MIEELMSIHLNPCERYPAADLLHSASKYIHRLERFFLVQLLIESSLPMSLEELERRAAEELGSRELLRDRLEAYAKGILVASSRIEATKRLYS